MYPNIIARSVITHAHTDIFSNTYYSHYARIVLNNQVMSEQQYTHGVHCLRTVFSRMIRDVDPIKGSLH